MNFEMKIKPFFWMEHGDSAFVCLNVGEYCVEVFETRFSEGFLGNGYDWESLVLVYLNEQMPELIDVIEFDSEAGMFCAFSSDKSALKTFILNFKNVCEDKEKLQDLFSRAELM